MFGNFYILFVRLGDGISLVMSLLLTLFGTIQFRSVDEIANKRNPARFMRWSKRKQLINQFKGGFLLDGKVGRLSRKVSFRSMMTTGGMGTGKSANLIILTGPSPWLRNLPFMRKRNIHDLIPDAVTCK